MPDGPPTALCPRCGVALICTFIWPRFEFYCLDCGGHFGWLQPDAGRPEEHAADYAARLAEWDAHAGRRLLSPGGWIDGCERCKAFSDDDPHRAHATEAELAADAEAREWLAQRVRA